jgi:hypothetical protein
VHRTGTKLVVELRGQDDYRSQVSQLITASGGLIIGMRPLVTSLEDAYLTVTDEALARSSYRSPLAAAGDNRRGLSLAGD